MMAAAIGLMLGVAHVAIAAADEPGIPRVAFFGFQPINTSLEPTTPIEVRRIKMLDDLFRQQLGNVADHQLGKLLPRGSSH
jgi:hypothetical protein